MMFGEQDRRPEHWVMVAVRRWRSDNVGGGGGCYRRRRSGSTAARGCSEKKKRPSVPFRKFDDCSEPSGKLSDCSLISVKSGVCVEMWLKGCLADQWLAIQRFEHISFVRAMFDEPSGPVESGQRDGRSKSESGASFRLSLSFQLEVSW
ncbi:hypothetical protein LINPERHAP1_LOCUS51 [Linum perenne]